MEGCCDEGWMGGGEGKRCRGFGGGGFLRWRVGDFGGMIGDG